MIELDKIPKVRLATLPTPLEEAPKLAAHIGLSKLLIKRDDLTGFAGGGNKARKLEYDFAEILNGKFDTIITAGGIQSNHARMTAAAARKFRLDIKLVLGGPDFEVANGNLLLDAIYNAEIRYMVNDDANLSLEREMKNWAEYILADGKRPYILPIGGSTGLGSLGYVTAMKELAEQIEVNKVQIVVGIGSCGTFAGTILGANLFLPNARVIGVSVSRTAEEIRLRTLELIEEIASKINLLLDNEIPIECYDNYHIEYGMITKDGEQTIYDCANLEGILLDPIYTGKVMAGLIDLTRRKIIDKNIPVVFIHTGGLPIIFTFANELGKNLRFQKIYSTK